MERIKKDLNDYKVAILAFAIYSIIIRKVFKAFCPFLIITGFPCAGCGLTRAMYLLVTFKFKRSMNMNPSAIAWLVLILYIIYTRYIKGNYNRKKVQILLALTCIITLAIYIYRMATCFPSYPPMVYYRNNIMMRIINKINW